MSQADHPALVLASGSATRQRLLRDAGLVFGVHAADLDEAAIKRQMQGEPPATIAMALADAKAQMALQEGVVVIGADQILVCEGRCFDKPHDLADAASHLRLLRGRTHTLVVAVTSWRDGRALWRHIATPSLTRRDVSDRFIDAYVAREVAACLLSVGAYRLEGLGAHLFSHVAGEHSAILGLPLLPLLVFLREAGVLLE